MFATLISFLLLFTSPIADVTTASSKVVWLTEQDHDFGEIQQNHPVKFIFQYKNSSDAPLTLETVRTTCGCTAAQWTETPVAPGGTGEIAVEYDAYQGGGFKKKIRVFFVEQKKAEILWIRGDTH